MNISNLRKMWASAAAKGCYRRSCVKYERQDKNGPGGVKSREQPNQSQQNLKIVV
jgi:hypothetical protein